MNNRRKFFNRLALFGAGLFLSNKTRANQSQSYMIHQVYFWLKDPEKDIHDFIKGCEKLITIDTIEKAYIGLPAPTEKREVVDHTFHVALTVHFSTLDDHNSYQVAPIHKEFIEQHQDKWEKVKVYDAKLS